MATEIALPYEVPDISVNRVGYYFAAQTIGDAYRRAVAGDANSFAWIKAAATIDDAHFAAAFSEVPAERGGPLTHEMMRSWFRAALAALEAPGGSSVTAEITVNESGGATISSPAPAPAPVATAPTAAAVAPAPTGGLQSYIPPGEPGSPVLIAGGVTAEAAPAPMTTPDRRAWVLWALGIVVGLWLLSRL